MGNNPSTFNRENRYLVFKRKDIARYLSDTDMTQLRHLSGLITKGREKDGRVPLNCVVVEYDWPESEAVWSMIEARMTGGVNFVDWQAHRILELERQLAECQKGAANE